MSARRALIIGIAGQDGSFLAELLLAEGYEVFGVVRQPVSDALRQPRGDPRRARAPPGGRARRALARRRAHVVPPARGLQPRLALVRPDVVAAAGADRRVRRRRLHGAARGDPARRRRDPLLPGVVERDLRRAARDAADRGDAARAGDAVRRGQGVRPLHHAELPAPLRAPRVVRDPLQPRVAAAAARLRDAEDRARRGRDQPRARDRGLARRSRRTPRLGLRRRLRARDVARWSSRTSPATT